MSEFRISNKTDYDVRFMPEGNKELLKLTPDGECYWNGRLVESDEDFKAAIISVSKYFIGASQPYHATIDRLTEQLNSKQDALSAALLALDNAVERCVGLEAELDRYKQGVEVETIVHSNGSSWAGFDAYVHVQVPLVWSQQRVRVLIMKEEE